MTLPKRDLTVQRFGTDTSGRGIYMTKYAWAVHQAVLRHPLVEPFADKVVIVQGAFMTRNGGGADASAGYHDLGGCWDIRTWNLTTTELDALIYVYRFFAGVAAWRRDEWWLHGGMDAHLHVTFGDDYPLSGGAQASWSGYLRGTDGLSSGRPDYEKRPSPLVTKPKAELFAKEDYMATAEAKQTLADIKADLAEVRALLEHESTADARRWSEERRRDQEDRQRQSERYKNLVSKIGMVADQVARCETGLQAQELILAVLRDEPDVTGADNPTPVPPGAYALKNDVAPKEA